MATATRGDMPEHLIARLDRIEDDKGQTTREPAAPRQQMEAPRARG